MTEVMLPKSGKCFNVTLTPTFELPNSYSEEISHRAENECDRCCRKELPHTKIHLTPGEYNTPEKNCYKLCEKCLSFIYSLRRYH